MGKHEQLKYLVASELDQLWGLFVTTVGFQDTAPDTAYPPAGHPSSYWFNPQKGRVLHEYQVIYVVKGEGLFQSAHVKPCRVTPGTLICLFPEEWHTFNPMKDTGWQVYWIGFNGEHAEGLKKNDFFSETQAVSDIGFNEQMVTLFEQGIQIAGLQQTGYQQMLAGVTHHLLSQLRRSARFDYEPMFHVCTAEWAASYLALDTKAGCSNSSEWLLLRALAQSMHSMSRLMPSIMSISPTAMLSLTSASRQSLP
ncbi:MAG: hypothetical protein EOO09_20260 [Chitinophagaceae bacterium]|nr:MAG: hypothetical protein EOO09_20260 [Chitinophagaceae bacterium]